jgi:hypothetical protein
MSSFRNQQTLPDFAFQTPASALIHAASAAYSLNAGCGG